MKERTKTMAQRPKGAWDPLIDLMAFLVLVFLVLVACPVLWTALQVLRFGR